MSTSVAAAKEKPKIFRPQWYLNSDLCDAGRALGWPGRSQV